MAASRMALLKTKDVEQPDPEIVGEESAKLRAWAALLASTDQIGDVLKGTGALLDDVASVLKPHMDHDDYLLTLRKIEALGYMLGTTPSKAFAEIDGLKLLIRDIADEVSLAAEHFAEYAREAAQT